MDTHPLGDVESSKEFEALTLTRMDNGAIRVTVTATGAAVRSQEALAQMYDDLP